MENKEKREMMIDAFPNESHSASCRGMTLRDYFANSAMQGICADVHTFWDSASIQGDPKNIAKLAFEIADAMLKERENETSK